MTKLNKFLAKGLILGSIVIGTLSGCTRLLDVKPTNALTVSTYDDVKALMGAHLKAFVNGPYNFGPKGVVPFFMTRDAKEYLYAHLYSDDFDVSQYLTWQTRNNISDFIPSLKWSNENAPGELWALYYRNIGFYNLILTSLEKYPSGDPIKNQQVAAEAKILRAWYFFRLMQYFVPYHEKDLGLPLNTDPDAVGSYDSSRQTQLSNYKFLISELEEVLTYTAKAKEGYNIFYQPRITHALLAQIYLHKGGSASGVPEDYDKAIEHANAALSSGLDYKVMRPVVPTAADSPAIFGTHTDRPYAGVVVVSDYDDMDYVAGNPWYGIPQYPSKALYELFSDNDKRKALNFTGKDHYINRYNSEFIYPFSLYEFFTGAEMKLIVAESYARKGDDNAAIKELTEFAATRYTGYERPASETVLGSILKERRREFCFDFTMRWMDLTRLQTGFTRTYKKAIDDNGETFTIKDNDYHFTFPIPNKEEIIENPIPQNPGWTNF